MQLRSRLLRIRLGLETVLGVRRSGFFIPYARAASTGHFEHQPYPQLQSKFAEREPEFQKLLDEIDSHAEALLAIEGLSPPQPRFEQDWFPRLDAAAHYAMVRRHRPKRIVEIGSGHSTRWLCRAIADEGLSVEFTAIDPQPRADTSRLAVKLQETTLQEADFRVFETLAAGDFLCMDSSHVFMPGSDVEVMVNRILPLVADGVFVFFHDIFLPDAYPADWAPLGYSEQNAVAALLQGPYEAVFSSAYAVRNMREAIDATVLAKIPVHPGGIENGLWLRKMR